MTTEEDSFLPDTLKDFVFDLHDSFRTSQIPSEQLLNYGSTFRDLTSKVGFFFCLIHKNQQSMIHMKLYARA